MHEEDDQKYGPYEDQLLGGVLDIKEAVAAIREGRYEPPRGASPDSRRTPVTPDDIYKLLEDIEGRLDRQNTLLWNIGLAVSGGDHLKWSAQLSGN